MTHKCPLCGLRHEGHMGYIEGKTKKDAGVPEHFTYDKATPR